MRARSFPFNVALAPLLLAAASVSSATSPAMVPGFSSVRSLGGITEYTLDANGLSVLVKADSRAPVVSFQITFRVGSRNESVGTTGATHILEHMMFKGSERYNDSAGNSVKQYIGRVGGINDASTSPDRTRYWATIGRDSLEGYIAIEADRMRNLWLRDSDRRAEMTVVRNEYERGENDATNALVKEVTAAAYIAQPYHHPTIGWRSDIERVPTARLKEFYDTFYWPNNATAIVVGDIDVNQALGMIRKHYGEIPRSPRQIPEMYTEEPPQTGPRTVTVKRAGPLGAVIVAYKAPAGLDPDVPALNILGLILSAGQNSRLSKALLDASLATSVTSDIRPSHDPGLFMIRVALAPGAKHEQVEKILHDEIDKAKEQGVTTNEVSRAIAQFKARDAYGRDGTTRIAAALNEWVAVGDWTKFVTYSDDVAKVTPADVQRVARKYLNEDQSTTGRFVPLASR